MITDQELIRLALLAREHAYTPYSHFQVGAALLSVDDHVYQGCNIENAGYTPSNCAERTAVFKAVSEGQTEFTKIAIVAGPEGQRPNNMTPPCGVCRQVLREFVDPKTFQVIVAISEESYKVFTLDQLLPLSFGPEDLGV